VKGVAVKIGSKAALIRGAVYAGFTVTTTRGTDREAPVMLATAADNRAEQASENGLGFHAKEFPAEN
jgi:hypothetical protein